MRWFGCIGSLFFLALSPGAHATDPRFGFGLEDPHDAIVLKFTQINGGEIQTIFSDPKFYVHAGFRVTYSPRKEGEAPEQDDIYFRHEIFLGKVPRGTVQNPQKELRIYRDEMDYGLSRELRHDLKVQDISLVIVFLRRNWGYRTIVGAAVSSEEIAQLGPLLRREVEIRDEKVTAKRKHPSFAALTFQIELETVKGKQQIDGLLKNLFRKSEPQNEEPPKKNLKDDKRVDVPTEELLDQAIS